MEARSYLDWLTPHVEPVSVPEYVRPVRCVRNPLNFKPLRAVPQPLKIVGTGPSLPIWGHVNPKTIVHGKSDPIWDRDFTTKFSAKPKEDAPLLTPKGHMAVIEKFLDRVSEIRYYQDTCHMELATIMQEMKTNGLSAFSLNAEIDGKPVELKAAEYSRVQSALDPAFVSAMERRIEWERYMSLCDKPWNIHKFSFVPKEDGTVGIGYAGPAKTREQQIPLLKTFVTKTLKRMGRLPTADEVTDGKAFCEFYNRPVMAYLTTDMECDIKYSEKIIGTEDPDPLRVNIAAEAWYQPADVGYAGPQCRQLHDHEDSSECDGSLGLDDEKPDNHVVIFTTNKTTGDNANVE